MNAAVRASMLLLAVGCADATVPDRVSPDAGTIEPTPDADTFHTSLVNAGQVCKLLSNRNASDPTGNDVQHAANVLGADLGIPVVTNDKLYIFFGDTIGYDTIWGATESHPDSVGYGLDSATAIAAQPDLLCNRLGIVTLPVSQSIGPGNNSAIKADFAGAAMLAPSGHSLPEYIHNPSGPSGSTSFPHLPGDFEVPSGAFAVNGSIYVFYTTVVGPTNVAMKGSYLAKWVSPTTTGPFGYQILYQVDERFDANGALHGHFINIAAEVVGDYVYLFGTGDYRRSKIYLARKPVAMIDQPGGFEELGEIVTTPGYGEISVRYFPSLEHWMLLAEELTPSSNHIVAYFAANPEGPWSAPIVVHDMASSSFRSQYCCTSEDNCIGQQMFNCNRTGFYGTYLFPAIDDNATSFKVTYTMSSFSPYNVALFEASFAK
ncbi:MAG TPA: DUF4185 domain-containing protein [Kofleriaceae bacterium]|nr:DUF4185 domain-containing protein [Kofleriaceae bacterium]